mgnify:CR=1 FL=1
MAKDKLSLGELELEVLKIIWERQPCTFPGVAEILTERRGLARTTVLTVIQRLHKKGFLERSKREGMYRYSTTKERGDVIKRLIGQFVNKVLDGSPVPFIAYLVEAEGLTHEQAEALRVIARELDQESGGEET